MKLQGQDIRGIRTAGWICRLLVTLFCLLLTSCGQDGGPSRGDEHESTEITLSYSAGPNGDLEGPARQVVPAGGDGLQVEAMPAEGYHFVSWSDNLTTPRRRDMNVSADLAVEASFALNQYTVTYLAGENGTITGAGQQIVQHGGAASEVTAVPEAHYHFTGWSDGVAAASRADSPVTADLQVSATFAIDQYTLTYAATGNGRIEGNGSQVVDHGAQGSKVSAVPDSGYHFVRWSDGLAEPERADAGVTGNLDLTAEFAPDRYHLRYSAGANGVVEGETSQTVLFGQSGSPVKAVANATYHFVRWSDGLTTPERTDRNIAADLTIEALFAIDQHNVIYGAKRNGKIAGNSQQQVDHGGTGKKVTAVPDPGYHFVSWSDGIVTPTRHEVAVTRDLNLMADFAINRYRLSYSAGDNGSLEGVSEQTIEHGSDGQAVTAVPDPGYHFVSWSDGLTEPRRVDQDLSGDLSVQALFEMNTYPIGGTLSGLVAGTELVLQNNAGDDLVLSANGSFLFATELLNGGAYDVIVLTQPTSPNQTCSVSGGRGIVAAAPVADIEVTCILNTYSIGGKVTGLPEGDRIELRNNKHDQLLVKANGPFNFSVPLDDGSPYVVELVTLPERKNWTCDLYNATGTLVGADVEDIVVDCYPKVVLQARAGIQKVEISWNSEDFKKVIFSLCRAEKDIPADGFDQCEELSGGAMLKGVENPLLINELTNDIVYWFQMEASYPAGRKTRSEIVKAVPFGGLNDTGIDWCADASRNYESDGTRLEKEQGCTALAVKYPGQDGMHGRDSEARTRKLSKKGSGFAGFDFTKVCRSGEAAGERKCPPNPLPGTGYDEWACTRDNVTGLMWEIKTDIGPRGKEQTYSWYNPDKNTNGGEAGQQGGGACEAGECDTRAYVEMVNEEYLCGYNDWRLPTRMELLSIVDNGRFKPAVDTRYFPNTLSTYYWTASPYQGQASSAWQVYFFYGETNSGEKTQRLPVRLVRGRTATFGLDNE